MPFTRDILHGFTLKRMQPGRSLILGTNLEVANLYSGRWVVRQRLGGRQVCTGYGMHNALYRLRELLNAQEAGERAIDNDEGITG